MTKIIEAQKKINSFHIQGKLVDDPIKDFNEDNKIIVFFKIRTRFNNTYVDVPLILTGKNSDAFATLFRKGDTLSVDGMFVSIDKSVHLWVNDYLLVKKNTKEKEVEDKFKKTVELYSLEGIERRKKSNVKKSKE